MREDWRNQNWNAFNKRNDVGTDKTQFPEFVKDFYFIKKGDSQTVLKFDKKNNSFEKAGWTDDLRNINQEITRKTNSIRF